MSEEVVTQSYTQMIDDAYAELCQAQAVLDGYTFELIAITSQRDNAHHVVEKARRKFSGLLRVE